MFCMNEKVQQRYDAFWENDVCDRFLTYMSVGGASLARPEGMDDATFAEYKWGNLEARAQNALVGNARKRFYLDGFPTEFVNFGPGSLAAYIGGNYVYASDTVWFDRNPVIKDWNRRPSIEFDPESSLWKQTVAYTDMLLNNGNSYVSVSDIGGTLDILASLRGTDNLLFDLYDNPENVGEAVRDIRRAWKIAYTLLSDRILARQDGITSWMPIWCRHRYAPLQCDFSAMISPDMFKEFVLSDLVELTEFLEKSIYHMDGPGEIPHLDHLLSIPRLNAIQWTSGAGAPDVTDACWFEMYDKIQAAGKSLVLFVEKPEQMEQLVKHLSPRGVFLSVYPKDDYDAQKISEMIEKLGIK